MFNPTTYIDKCLEFLKKKINVNFLETNESALVKAGLFCLTFIMPALAVITGITFCVRFKLGGRAVLCGIALALICLFLRYVADKMLPYTQSVLKKSPSQISSRAILDIFTVTIGLIGVGYFGKSLYQTFTARTLEEGFGIFFTGAIFFFVCEYVMAMLLSPKESLNISLEKETSAAAELIGIFSLVVKSMYRMVPLIFGFAMIAAVIFMLKLLFSSRVGIPDIMEFCEVLSMALLPLGAYIMFLMYYFLLDLCMAFLRVPEKLDALSKKK